jgi:hypothetical protein
MNDFLCPVCHQPLDVCEGTSLNAKDGVTVYCPNRQCPAQEVSGHGANMDKAFEVVQEKFPIDRLKEPAIL